MKKKRETVKKPRWLEVVTSIDRIDTSYIEVKNTVPTTAELKRIQSLNLRSGLFTNFLTTYPKITERKTINNCQNSNKSLSIRSEII